MGNAVAETGQVIQPARTRMRLERRGAEMELHRRGWGVGATGFLIVWLIAWTAGCAMLAGQCIRQPQAFMLLFATPFWASWFAVAGYIAHSLFSFERLSIGRGGAQLLKGIGPWTTRRRQIPLSELRRAKRFKSSYEVNENPVYGVQIRTVGKPITVAVGVDSDEREWLIATINQQLAVLGAGTSVGEESNENTESVPLRDNAGHKPPSDCTWEMSPTVTGIEFVRRGRFKLGAFAGLTFLNLFWNGIVSVFVATLVGLAPVDQTMGRGEWWFLFFFLIPFEAIGLMFVWFWLASLTMPAWREQLTLDRHEIMFHFSVFGIGSTRQLATVELSAMDVRRKPTKKSINSALHEEGEWDIVLAGKSNRELLRLAHLTEGEATWIAAQVRRMYPRAFKTPAT
jgi:hypothetical protein